MGKLETYEDVFVLENDSGMIALESLKDQAIKHIKELQKKDNHTHSSCWSEDACEWCESGRYKVQWIQEFFNIKDEELDKMNKEDFIKEIKKSINENETLVFRFDEERKGFGKSGLALEMMKRFGNMNGQGEVKILNEVLGKKIKPEYKVIGHIYNRCCEKDYCRKYGKLLVLSNGFKLIKLCKECKEKMLR